MNRRLVMGAGAAGVLMAAAVMYFVSRTAPIPAETSRPSKPAEPPARITDTDKAVATARKSIPIEQLAGSEASPEQKLQRVYVLVQNYHQALRKRSGPPLNSNRDFTQALTGRNPLKIRFLPPGHPAISAGGELLDAWDTPYFFHALAADSTEVQSAGPDRIHFNTDDLVFPPPMPGDAMLGSIRSQGMRDRTNALTRPGGP